MSLGGTRFRVLMGTAQCPGCHFGHGLEVDLYGQSFMEIVAMLAAGGAGVVGGGEPIPMDEGGAPTTMPSEPLAPRQAGCAEVSGATRRSNFGCDSGSSLRVS